MESNVSREIRDRIWQAADYLYEQAGRGDTLPTVDAVRRQAKANMNDVSLVMKDWRDAQKATVKTVTIEVPDSLSTMGKQMLAACWQHAQDTANESLRAAQASWDAERTEAEAIIQQISQAFDEQSAQLQQVESDNARLSAEVERNRAAITQLQERNQELTRLLAEATAEASKANARADEIESRANELRKELDHAHAQAERAALHAENERIEQQRHYDDLKAERDEAKQVFAGEIGKLQAQLEAATQARDEARADRDNTRSVATSERESHTSEITRLQSRIDALTEDREEARKERDASREDAIKARESAARLSGELDALKKSAQGKAPKNPS
ncbi:DNA-binding protein (plasmid) [Pseudomonas sp. WOUb67]|uniref:DNA-binding protein n=1 Tax=Pseudomonas sp. WOUb67 TaxID=3161136 RepID=UPI003CF775DD